MGGRPAAVVHLTVGQGLIWTGSAEGFWDVGDSLDLNSLSAAGVHPPTPPPQDLNGEDTLSLRRD